MVKWTTKTAVAVEDVKVFNSPKNYQEQLFQLIEQAQTRIYITALYLQDDEAGRAILTALYQAKQRRPQLIIKVFVDAHRAQRGLIGEKEQLGNRARYLEFAQQYDEQIDIYGVSVKRKEFFGVLHLKGMVFDDTVFYTGASINNVYLHYTENYRLDRYYQINSSSLSDCFCKFLDDVFVDSNNAYLLNVEQVPELKQQQKRVQQLKALLRRSNYQIASASVNESASAGMTIQPLVGCGRRANQLNNTIRQLVQNSQQQLLLFTPYFNLPKALVKDIVKALKRGVNITIVVGDKKANDFFIRDNDDFSTIGIVPYIYEVLLARFIKRWQKYLTSGQLTVRLWQDDCNSFHLKGIIADQRYHLLTGSNLNPRAWSLDLENGLLIDDAQQMLMPQVELELEQIINNTQVISHVDQLDTIQQYPTKPQKLLRRLRVAQIDRILKRFL